MSAERSALLERAQEGDRSACERLLAENAGLIWSVVRHYGGRGVETDDLYQLGCIGFIKAVKGFNFSLGTAFSTYAVPKIAGEIRRFLRDDAPVKLERGVRERALRVCAARDRLCARLGREPTLSELAAETGQTREEIAELELAAAPPQSLQQEVLDGVPLEQTIPDARREDLTEALALRAGVDALPERERMTILLRFYKDLTQAQTARILGVSQVQVSRLERRALDRLRAAMTET